jgi:hypothetical protein
MTKEQFLEVASAHYEELNALNKIDDFYTYETGFIDIWSSLGRAVLEKNIGAVPTDRRKKNANRFWGDKYSE